MSSAACSPACPSSSREAAHRVPSSASSAYKGIVSRPAGSVSSDSMPLPVGATSFSRKVRASHAQLGMQPRRCFATSAYSVKASGTFQEQSVFLIGLNEGKFFGQDSAEEGLKLMEKVSDYDPEYELGIGLSETHFQVIEEDHKVTGKKLTPSRDLESSRDCEFIPLIQAAMVDRRPRRALSRDIRFDQARVSWKLWQNPRETVNLYWAIWRRKSYKNAESYRFWSKHFPISADAYFGQRAELISLRAFEQISHMRRRGQGKTLIVAVSNDIFGLVHERLNSMLGQDASERLASPEHMRTVNDRAAELCKGYHDISAFILFVYFFLPFFVLRNLYPPLEYYYNKRYGSRSRSVEVEDRE